MSKLTFKRQRFVDEYIISGNATDAYIKAGYSAKKRSVAEANARKLLGEYSVDAYLKEKMEELQSDKIADQNEILEYLTRVMRREEDENQVVTLREKEEKWVQVDDKGTLKKQVVENERAEVVPIPTKVSDSNKAAELLGKRHAMWTDKIDQTNKNIEITLGEWSDDDED